MSEDRKEVIEAVEVIEPTALEAITRGEIDVQIATAHRFPRSIAAFVTRGKEMISVDTETAESCIYRRPVGKERGKQKYAEGLSIRMAEIVGACYGNLRVGSLLIEQTPRYVKARGFAHDLESNFAATSEVIESTVDKEGKPYSERMAVVVAKAALAKARRDATFMVVPKAMCRPLESTARKVAIGDESTLLARRQKVMAWVDSLRASDGKKLDRARVFAALELKGEADIGLEELEILTGIRTGINDGDVTVDEAFPPMMAAAKPVFAKKGESTESASAPAPADPAPANEPANQADSARSLFDKKPSEVPVDETGRVQE